MLYIPGVSFPNGSSNEKATLERVHILYNTQIFHPANMLVETSHMNNVKMADTFHQSKTAYIYIRGGKKII